MRFDAPEDDRPRRQTVVIPTGARMEYGTKMYCHMLVEDLHLQIIPYSLKRAAAIRGSIKTDKKEDESVVAAMLQMDSARDASSSIVDFIREAAQFLGFFGDAQYEIARAGKKTTLYHIPAGSFRSEESGIVQDVPAQAAQAYNLPNQISVPQEDVFVLEMPEPLGGKAGHQKRLQLLAAASDQSLPPEFAMAEWNPDAKDRVFDMRAHQKNFELQLAGLTRDIGWAARGAFDKQFLSSYAAHRHIKFAWACALIREEIVESLNLLLEKLSSDLGFRSSVEVAGLPTSTDLESCLARLSAGELTEAAAYRLAGLLT
jgi:hypothetical protein